jgi:hypothetical protein
MTTQEILRVFKLQGTALNDAPDKELWWSTIKIKLNRSHLIQAIKELQIWVGIIPTKNIDTFLSNNTWSDLVNTLEKFLDDVEKSA